MNYYCTLSTTSPVAIIISFVVVLVVVIFVSMLCVCVFDSWHWTAFSLLLFRTRSIGLYFDIRKLWTVNAVFFFARIQNKIITNKPRLDYKLWINLSIYKLYLIDHFKKPNRTVAIFLSICFFFLHSYKFIFIFLYLNKIIIIVISFISFTVWFAQTGVRYISIFVASTLRFIQISLFHLYSLRFFGYWTLDIQYPVNISFIWFGRSTLIYKIHFFFLIRLSFSSFHR